MKIIPLSLLAVMLAVPAFAAENQPDAAPSARKADGPRKKADLKWRECDKDQDGFLSKEDFTACFPRMKNKFAEIDANQDGKVSWEEMAAFRNMQKEERSMALFKKCDKNNDGMLSQEEFALCKSSPHDGKKR